VADEEGYFLAYSKSVPRSGGLLDGFMMAIKDKESNSACRGLFILLDYAWCGVEYPSLMILQPTYWDGFSSYSALRFVGRAVKWTIKFNSATIMLCECGRDPGVEPSKNAVGVTCAYCVQKMVAPPDYPKASSALSFEEKQAKKKAKAEKKAANSKQRRLLSVAVYEAGTRRSCSNMKEFFIPSARRLIPVQQLISNELSSTEMTR
jgi:hypothetical protein